MKKTIRRRRRAAARTIRRSTTTPAFDAEADRREEVADLNAMAMQSATGYGAIFCE